MIPLRFFEIRVINTVSLHIAYLIHQNFFLCTYLSISYKGI